MQPALQTCHLVLGIACVPQLIGLATYLYLLREAPLYAPYMGICFGDNFWRQKNPHGAFRAGFLMDTAEEDAHLRK